MGHHRYKALVLKELRKLCKEQSIQELNIKEYHEADYEIVFVVDPLKQIDLYLLQAFADLFLTKDVSVKEIQGHYPEYIKGFRISVKNPDVSNIHRSRRILPESMSPFDRFDLEIDEEDEE